MIFAKQVLEFHSQRGRKTLCLILVPSSRYVCTIVQANFNEFQFAMYSKQYHELTAP